MLINTQLAASLMIMKTFSITDIKLNNALGINNPLMGIGRINARKIIQVFQSYSIMETIQRYLRGKWGCLNKTGD